MHDIGHYLGYVNQLLIVSVVLGAVFQFLKLSPVLGYFVAGALISKFTTPGHGIQMFAEIGIVFLLFVIGIELTVQRLISMSKHVFGFGTLQVAFSTLIMGGVAYWSRVHDITQAFVIGAAFAMSSTAIVLQVLQTTNRQSTPAGRLALAVLIMQDLAVVPLLVLVPLLASEKSTALARALLMASGKGLVVLVIIFVTGRLLLRPMFKIIASLSSQELFLSTTILIILGASYITDHFGLSMALGAFVAGLLMAETPYRNEIEHVVFPFKSLLLGLFFMTVGMSINFDTLVESAAEIALVSSIVILCKCTVVFLLCRLFGFRLGPSIQAGLLLSQGGEFAFILLKLASEEGIIPVALSEKYMMVVTVTMAVTPLLAAMGNKIASALGEATKKTTMDILVENADMRDHVIIVGFGNFGKTLARILSKNSIYYVAFDINGVVVNEAQKHGYSIYRGDATKVEIYGVLSAKRSLSIVITLGNSITAAKAVGVVRDNFPNANIIIYTYNMSAASGFAVEDLSNIYAADLEGAIKIASGIIMKNSDIDPEELVDKMHSVRNSEYKMLYLDQDEESN